VNKTVKHKEEWRPFAPSLLPAAADKNFVGERRTAPRFVIDTYETTDRAEEEIPAVFSSR